MNTKFSVVLALCLLSMPTLHAQASDASPTTQAPANKASSPPEASSAILNATTVAAFSAVLSATAAIFVARVNRRAQKEIQTSNAETQKALQLLANDLRQNGLNEERTFAMTTQQAEPFFTALIKSQHLLTDAAAHAQELARVCPLSPEYKRSILAGTGINSNLTLAGVELSERLASVLMVLDEDLVNDFVTQSRKLISSQTKLGLMLALSFDFDEKAFKEPGANMAHEQAMAAAPFFTLQKSHSDAAAALFMLIHQTLTRRKSGMKPKPPTWHAEGLAQTLRLKSTASIFDFSNPVAVWSVWWTRERQGKAAPGQDEFKLKFDELLAAVRTAEGFLEIRQEAAHDNQHEHIALSVDFTSAEHRDQFLKSLPSIKAQSRILWGPFSRETVTFRPVVL